jgi:hypothetical protein
MPEQKVVLIVGIDPTLIDFSSPDFARFNMTAERVQSALQADGERLRSLGYEADFCGTDFGGTAVEVLEEKLRGKSYDCVLIGAGVRVVPANLVLFERLINAIHANAPRAKICFNTNPSDTAEAVMRWV